MFSTCVRLWRLNHTLINQIPLRKQFLVVKEPHDQTQTRFLEFQTPFNEKEMVNSEKSFWSEQGLWSISAQNQRERLLMYYNGKSWKRRTLASFLLCYRFILESIWSIFKTFAPAISISVFSPSFHSSTDCLSTNRLCLSSDDLLTSLVSFYKEWIKYS